MEVVQDLEIDKETLDKKEKHIIQTIQKLEKSKDYKRALREMKADKKAIKEKESEVIKLIKKMEKDMTKMDMFLQRKNLFEQKMNEILEKEEELNKRETRLVAKEGHFNEIVKLSPKIPDLVDERKIPQSEESVKELSHMLLSAEGKRSSSEKPKLSELIEYTRGFISARDFELAKKSIASIEKEVKKIKASEMKRKINYDLVELRTKLDLAELGA